MTEETRIEGFTLEELEAQPAGLLPERVPMRRRRRRRPRRRRAGLFAACLRAEECEVEIDND